MNYLQYNREERDLCAHLFRLLLEDQPNWGPLKKFLGKEDVINPRIFCEVALIRDAYKERVKNGDYISFMNSVVEIVADQEDVTDYTKFDELDKDLRDPKSTHPKQIAYKMKNQNYMHKKEDPIVYGALQGMFNAKPDLIVCEGGNLFVYEAKYTLGFDGEQLKRTENIASVWKTLLFKDLGFTKEPEVKLFKLGLKKKGADISWKEVSHIAHQFWGNDDFSTKVFLKVLQYE